MPLKIFFLSLVTLCSFGAQAATYGFVPDSDYARECESMGFVGRFAFTHRSDNIYDVKFANSGAHFVVFGAGNHRYVMSISGSWSESIRLDFNNGNFSYDSGRPTLPGTCYGQIGR